MPDAPFVMVSLATYERIDPAGLAAFSPTVIDGMLRGDLGFDGVVISDALGATAVASIAPATRAIDFLAGRRRHDHLEPDPRRRSRWPRRCRGRAPRPTTPSAIGSTTRRSTSCDAKEAAGLLPCVISTNEQRATPAAS